MDFQNLEQLRDSPPEEAAIEILRTILAVGGGQAGLGLGLGQKANLSSLSPNPQMPAASEPASPAAPGVAELQQMLQNTGDILVVYDRQLRYVWINPAGAAQLGLAPETVVGKTNQELFGLKSPAIEVPVRRVLETGQRILATQDIPLPSGGKIYESVYTPVKDASGTVTGVIGLAREAASTGTSPALQPQTEQYRALSGVIARIRESLDLDTIFKATVTEVRQLLQADRVAVFRFYPEADWEGEIVEEDAIPGIVSALTVRVQDRCFGERYATYYQQGRVAAIDNTHTAGLKDCYLEILDRFQIRANLVAPLRIGDRLWGLLCVHQCTRPRHWEASEIEFVTQIAEHLGVALQHAEYLERVRAQSEQLDRVAQRQKTLSAIVDKIRRSLDINTIFQTATQEVRRLLSADRVAVYRFGTDWSGEFVAESFASGWNPLVGVAPVIQDTHLQQTQGGRYSRGETFAVDDIYSGEHTNCHIDLLEQFQAKAYAVAPILQGDKLWGLLAAYQNSEPRHWEEYEVELLAEIGEQLGVALQQAEYLEQVKAQSAQLQRAAQLERAIAATVDKIRRSLDTDTIFLTTTQEVRLLLQADRVGVYRFKPDWSGEFVAESFASGWAPLLGIPIEDTYLQESRGGRYSRGETLAVDDIYSAGHADCHIQLLERFQAKAYAIVPILQGETLWGLLAAYQNSQPRHWEKYEVELLAQIGVQLGVALQQAELLAQTRRQAQKLAQTVRDLQQTQTQLIQSEKMASLGQLVAGVAHEINNPVNFIYGNLGYVEDYTRDLLSLVRLYQEECPPSPAIEERLEEIELEFLSSDLPRILSSMKVGSDRMRQLVLSLRNFSRLDEAEKKPVDIHQGIDSTLLILQHRLKAKSNSAAIEVVREYGQLPLVMCYPAQLNQVFMNILSNAIDAIEDADKRSSPAHEMKAQPSKITIRTQMGPGPSGTERRPEDSSQLSGGQTVVIRIADSGPGIPEEVRQRIFEPFFTTKPVGKGTGLGLSISYQIVVEKHGGALHCVSQPGCGTEFSIEIPIGPNA